MIVIKNLFYLYRKINLILKLVSVKVLLIYVYCQFLLYSIKYNVQEMLFLPPRRPKSDFFHTIRTICWPLINKSNFSTFRVCVKYIFLSCTLSVGTCCSQWMYKNLKSNLICYRSVRWLENQLWCAFALLSAWLSSSQRWSQQPLHTQIMKVSVFNYMLVYLNYDKSFKILRNLIFLYNSLLLYID